MDFLSGFAFWLLDMFSLCLVVAFFGWLSILDLAYYLVIVYRLVDICVNGPYGLMVFMPCLLVGHVPVYRCS